jgi:hypothetical protein
LALIFTKVFLFSHNTIRASQLNNLGPWLDLLQWPALIVTVIAAWLVAENKKSHREIGFWVFLLSNILWVAWGWYTHAYALIALQFFLAFSNFRGMMKNKE